MTTGCTLCKKEGKKSNKYYGGVYCDTCMSDINKAVKTGTMPAYRPGIKSRAARGAAR